MAAQTAGGTAGSTGCDGAAGRGRGGARSAGCDGSGPEGEAADVRRGRHDGTEAARCWAEEEAVWRGRRRRQKNRLRKSRRRFKGVTP